MRRLRYFPVCLLVTLLAAASACSTSGRPPEAAAADTVTTATGLRYGVTQSGDGPVPDSGQYVLVHYTGSLTSGEVFDSSRERGEPIGFQLGAGQVIPGWDEGIARLRVGDRAVLIIPPELGYGERGAGGGVIPPNATLVFDVELVGVRDSSAVPILEAAAAHGPDSLRATYRRLERTGALDRLYFSEGQLNAAGYRALGAGRPDEAVALFELNTEIFPQSYNTFDSLGEGLLAAGDTTRAVETYRTAQRLNPRSTEADREAYARVEVLLETLAEGR